MKLFYALAGVGSLFGNNLGSLDSIISAESLAKDSVWLFDIEVADDHVYAIEIRPEEKGRTAVYDITEGKDILPLEYSCRNCVHEYGSNPLTSKNNKVYFTQFPDNQIYRLESGKVEQVTSAKHVRFAEPKVCGDYIFAVAEDHTSEKNVKNGIARVYIPTGDYQMIECSHDFYAGLTISPDESTLSYFTWDFPDMSWDRSLVWKVELDKEKNFTKKTLVSKKGNVSSVDPSFDKDGNLYYVTDSSGYWNVVKENGKTIFPKDADQSKPHWYLSKPFYTILDNREIAMVVTDRAVDSLWIIKEGKPRKLNFTFQNYRSLTSKENTLYFLADSPSESTAMYSYHIPSNTLKKLRESENQSLESSWISKPRRIGFTTRHGDTAYAFYYAPKNPNHTFTDEKPPLMIMSHGGPTGHVTSTFKLSTQFWTSRGFAVCDVNYSGSSGHGREYRNRLYNNWGIRDVDDCEDAALYLIKEGLADKNRTVVRGGSAGGYTTMALLTFRDTFTTGTSYFGVSDMASLAIDDHKFESRYLDHLVGKYPEDKEIYIERSPIYHVERLNNPILLLQGSEDKIVPPKHSEIFYQAALSKGLPTAYICFEGEGHGFRKKENLIKSLESELYFYQKIFGQKTTFDSPPLKIENLKEPAL